ncbi:hypothetical protein IWQ57_001830 [Coemansia nantahalensis]|uniref:Uncharacterized protein n=2 Tax=Coemansia TaxID=4863 RepID=A0ACC1K347_9FUNG|nr:hypothetical protein IWQ57_001830 [Coemansia nantahalensis]
MADQPQTPTPARYSLRVRTPKAEPWTPPSPVTATPTRRKRAKTASSTQKPGRGQATPAKGRTPAKKTAARRRSARAAAAAADGASGESGNDEGEHGADGAASVDEEVLVFGSNQREAGANYSDSEASDAPGQAAGRGFARMRRSEKRVSTPAKRAGAALTRGDAFSPRLLDAAEEILRGMGGSEQSGAEKYEQMKMCDALKMCGYNLDVANLGSVPISEVYLLLSWAVHPAGPCPQLSATARGVLLKVFASVGSRFREETKDMAAYHRRHALRKLLLASDASPKDDGDDDGDDDEGQSPKDLALRRNPLKIPAPLVDIWKEPYKKAAGGGAGGGGHESPGSDA